MSFKVEWHPRALKNYRHLPHDFQSQVQRKISEAIVNPFYFLEPYKGDKYFKLRIGSYRALVDLDRENKIFSIRMFDHRKKVYKNTL